jgi:hypothetical protein
MKIIEMYSHLNGWEHLKVHKAKLWDEIVGVIDMVDANKCRTKVSKEIRMKGKLLFSPDDMNAAFLTLLAKQGWGERRTSYWVTADPKLNFQIMSKPANEQEAAIKNAGKHGISTYTQTDFVKDRVAIEVQFGKYAFVAYDMFVKHLAHFVGDVIDVGVEILPMKALQQRMSSGVPYYEKGLYDMQRAGRTSPPVPLVVIGVEP